MFGVALGANAQQSPFFAGMRESFKHKPKPDVRLDTRNSFITSRVARIRGVKLGLDFNKTVKLGLGYNWLSSDVEVKRSYTAANGEQYAAPFKLHFGYVSPYFEYTFYRDKRWEFSIPLHLGIGAARFRYTDDVGAEYTTKGVGVLLYEPYMTALYKPIRYLGVGVGTGYRLLLVGNRQLPGNLNSPIYVFKFSFFAGELWNDVVGRK